MPRVRRLLPLIFSLLSALLPLVASLAELPGDLEGSWTASGRKFVVTRTTTGWRVHGWGKCSPGPCDWGETALEMVAPAVDSREYSHALAVWKSSFAITYAVFRLEPGAPPVVELFTVFTDRSARSSWTVQLHLQRER